MNIDIIEGSTDHRASEYLYLTANQGLLPAPTGTTRSRTCLDHIILKTKHNSKALVLHSNVTDHSAVIILLLMDIQTNSSLKRP